MQTRRTLTNAWTVSVKRAKGRTGAVEETEDDGKAGRLQVLYLLSEIFISAQPGLALFLLAFGIGVHPVQLRRNAAL